MEKSLNQHVFQRCSQTKKEGFKQRETLMEGEGRGNQSFQSFLIVRLHSQERWSCLSSSVNLDLML